MRTALLTLLAAVVIAAAPGDRKDLEKMQGDWACTRMVISGMQLPDDDAGAMFRTIKGDEYTVFRFDKQIGMGTLKLDPNRTPRTIDALPSGPAGKGKPILGIYMLDGEMLTLCFAAPGKDRPTAFESKEDSGHTLTVWTREKK